MKYSLSSLMIVVMVGPPVLAGAWFVWNLLRESHGLIVGTAVTLFGLFAVYIIAAHEVAR